MTDLRTVTVAALTFRRNDEVSGLLPELLAQLDAGQTGEDIEVLVVDNDPAGGARPVVEAIGDSRVRYVIEPRPGIAAARNRALDECVGRDVLVFIDDDERPTEHWLRRLLDTRALFDAAAVAGPVLSEFEGAVEPWIDAGAFFGRRHRTHLQTGAPIAVAATNNLLLDLREVRRLGVRFSIDVGMASGEDNLFTRSLTKAGGTMVWCADALVTEKVPAQRATRRWVLLRSLSSGNGHSRVTLLTAPGGVASLRLRATLLVGGVVRILGGVTRCLAGCLGGSITHRARGTRTAFRGVGMVLGATGYSYQAYRRKGEPTETSDDEPSI